MVVTGDQVIIISQSEASIVTINQSEASISGVGPGGAGGDQTSGVRCDQAPGLQGGECQGQG